MKYLKVNLWGQEIGRLVWDPTTRRTYFMYNPELKDRFLILLRYFLLRRIETFFCLYMVMTDLFTRGFLRLLLTRCQTLGATRYLTSG